MNNIVKAQENISEMKALARIAFESKQYKDMSETSLLNLMLSARSLGVDPMKAINGGFYIVNGKVSMSTSLMADMIRKAGHSISIETMSKEKCIISAKRKDNGDKMSFEFTMEDAQVAQLTGSPTWKKFPKQMLYNRCMSTIARTLFSDVIGNAYDPDEAMDIKGVPAEKRPLMDETGAIEVETVLTGINTETGEIQKLSEDQCGELDAKISLVKDENIVEDIKKFFNLDDIYNMSPDQFKRCLIALDRKIAKQEPETTVVS